MAMRKSQIIVLTVLVSAALVFFGMARLKPKAIPPRNISPAARQEVSGNIPGARAPVESREEKKDLRCTIVGISYNKTNPLVVIENNAYVPGDSVCGGTIARINRERVTVKFPRGEKIFVIGDKVID
jgi:hypothetical protein